MPNIIFTNRCNLQCPYCFANSFAIGETVCKNSKRNSRCDYLSIDKLKKIIEYLKKLKINSIGILGGEPTLHPEFNSMLEVILESSFTCILFTNGLIMDEKKVDYLASLDKIKVSISLNINEPSTYRSSELNLITHILDVLREKVTLFFTIYNKDCDMMFLVELIKKYQLNNTVRVGIAQPRVEGNNVFLPLSDYKTVAKKIVEFASYSYKDNIRLCFDCGFIRCMFSEREIKRMMSYGMVVRFLCSPVIDINLDLSIWRCFSLSSVSGINLCHVDNIDALMKYYFEKFKFYKLIGITNKCFKCNYLHTGGCSGGCLAAILISFKKADGSNFSISEGSLKNTQTVFSEKGGRYI